MKILGLEIKDRVYNSDSYQMFVNGATPPEIQKELNKTYYIEDKTERLKKVREILNNHKNKPTISNNDLNGWENNGFSDYDSFVKYKAKHNENMFFGCWVELSNKRVLEIEVYVLERYQNAENIATSDIYGAISYLIDEQFTYHKGVFDNIKDDFIFREQYNMLIYDLLQKKINELYKTEFEDIREVITKATKKPLIWNAKKTSIGTLFGMLHNAKVITGTKQDLIKAVSSMFGNLSESTIKDNVNLKVNTNDRKTLYDVDTEKMLTDWVKYLKDTTKQQK